MNPWSRLAFSLAIGGALIGCAPVQEGADQCSDVNINLLEVTDAKYATLPQAEGGLSPGQQAQVDAAVESFLTTVFDSDGTPQLVDGAPRLRETPIAGCAIAVTRNQQIAYLQGYGKADLAGNRPFTIATPSAIGSIAKTLTALGAMTLVEQGELDLDSGVLAQTGLIPGVDVPWQDASLRQVLAHRGGFRGMPLWDAAAFDDGPSMAAAFPNIDFPHLQPVLAFQGYKSRTDNQPQSPGSPASYSNVGYSVAGTLIDVHSKSLSVPAHQRGYESFLWHRVGRGGMGSAPNMSSMCLATDFRTADIKNFATGYAQDGTVYGFGDDDRWGWGWEGPSGGWSMTIGDLGRLMIILQSSAVVAKDLIDSEMRASQGQLFGDGTRAGLGLELSPAGSTPWFGKGGDILGYTADLKIWPSNVGTDWGVAFMCNQQGTGKGLTMAVRTALSGGGGGIGRAGGSTAPPTASPETIERVKQYEPEVRALAERYLDPNHPTQDAWPALRRSLLELNNGPKVVRAIESGDFATAVRLLPELAD